MRRPGSSTSVCGIIGSWCGSVYSAMSRSFCTLRPGSERKVQRAPTPGAELVRLGQAVSADGHQPAVPDLHLAMKLQEPFHLQPVLGTEASAAEYQHQRVGPLQLRELAALAAVIG